MKYIIPILVLVLLFSFVPRTQEVNGMDIFNTGAFACVPEEKPIIYWTNETGQDIKIYSAKVWFGANSGAIADVGVIVFRERGESILFHQNWDRYAEPTALHVDTLNLAPNYFLVKAGERVGLVHWCHPINEQAKKAHVIVTVWYE